MKRKPTYDWWPKPKDKPKPEPAHSPAQTEFLMLTNPDDYSIRLQRVLAGAKYHTDANAQANGSIGNWDSLTMGTRLRAIKAAEDYLDSHDFDQAQARALLDYPAMKWNQLKEETRIHYIKQANKGTDRAWVARFGKPK